MISTYSIHRGDDLLRGDGFCFSGPASKSVLAFVDINGLPFLMSHRGVITGVFPIDHLDWTAGIARREAEVSSAIKQIQGVTGKELLITATAGPVARKAQQDRRWTVRDRFEEQILLKTGY